MSIFIVILLVFAAAIAIAAWAGVLIVIAVCRAAWWGICLPFRVMSRLALPPATRGMPSRPESITIESSELCCGNEKCGSNLPAGAKFCPRCGAMVLPATGGMKASRFASPVCRVA